MGDHLVADLRLAIRGYRRRLGLTLSVFSILALAIGAVTATYSLLDWVILRPLPYPDANHIYSIGFPQGEVDPRPRASLRDFDLLQSSVHDFNQLAISRWNSGTLSFGDEADQLDEDVVSPSFFSLLGARVQIGRPFLKEDYLAAGAPVALLSFDIWRQRFRGDPNVVGTSILLNAQPYTVIGVLSRNFHDPLEYRRHAPVDLWLPLVRSGQGEYERLYYIQGHLARLRTADQARVSLQVLEAREKNGMPNQPQVVELQRSLTGSFHLQLILLSGAVVLLLLIACANVAGLLLSRGASLEGEMAVRLALGANRLRLVQQQLTETLLLSLCAGIFGLVCARLVLSSIERFLPIDLPRVAEMKIDGRIAAFTLIISLLAAAAAGLWPAIRASGTQLSEQIRGAASGLSQTRRWRNLGFSFVVLQISLSFVLLAGATLLAKSFWLLMNVDSGFAAKHVLTMRVRLPRPKYSQAQQRSAFYAEALRTLSSVPTVTAAAMVTALPLGGNGFSEPFLVEDHPVASDEQRPQANWNLISPNYFRTFNIPLRAGRFPADDDLKRSANLLVINRYIADRYWPHQSAIGKHLRFGSVHDHGSWAEVIGVVGDVKQNGLDSAEEPQIYQLYPVLPPPFGYFVIRTDVEPAALAITARKAISLVDRTVPVENIASMSEVVSTSTATPRFRTGLLVAFSCFAIILTALGIYGAIAYSVARRKREIGIRMALGASPQSVRASVLVNAGLLVLGGLLLGIVGAVAFMRALQSMLFSVKPLDISVLMASIGLLIVIGLGAALIPAGQAAEIDPVRALRQD